MKKVVIAFGNKQRNENIYCIWKINRELLLWIWKINTLGSNDFIEHVMMRRD